MIFVSSLLREKYPRDAENIFSAFAENGVEFALIGGRDVWVRDFMPIATRSGDLVSFRYEPSYLVGYDESRTDFSRDIKYPEKVTFSDVSLDGGNVVFSPSRRKAIVSDRVFTENPEVGKEKLMRTLIEMLEADVTVIHSLKSDMTGHADGCVRFRGEDTVLANRPLTPHGFEQRVIKTLAENGFEVVTFPFFAGEGAVGCYINYLETERHIFLPVFGSDRDHDAVSEARRIFRKEVVPVELYDLPRDGGALNCVTWETEI